jgi:hypothetical protein
MDTGQCIETRFPMKRLKGIEIPALEDFEAEPFLEDISKKLNLKVRFDYNFKRFLLPRIEKGIVPAECLAVYKPLESIQNATLLKLDKWEYGVAEIGLGQFLTAFVVEYTKVPGEYRSLTDKDSNTGFIRGTDGMLWPVNGYIDHHEGLFFKADLPEELENQVLSPRIRTIRHAPAQYEMPFLSSLLYVPPPQMEAPSVLVT